MAEPVTVVIPTRNGANTLPALFEALRGQRSARSCEWIVLDTESSDGSAEIARRCGARVENVCVDEFDHGATRNLGASLGSAPFVVFLSQDAVPASATWLDALLEPFADPRVAGVFGRQLPRPDCEVLVRRRIEQGVQGGEDPHRSELGALSFDALPPAERMRRSTFDNVCSAVRRECLDAHPFPAGAPAEDIAWGRELLCAGWALEYAPLAAVVHSHRRSLRYEFERMRVEHRRLHELFGLVTLPRGRDLLRAGFRNAVRDLPFVARHAPPGAERRSQLARCAALSWLAPLAQYRGARDRRTPRPPRVPV